MLPTEVEAQALAALRGKALSQNTSRLLLLQACAVAVERELKRIVWPGLTATPERTSTALVIVRDRDFAVPFCSLYPETFIQSLTSVRLWSDDAQDWTTLAASTTTSNGYRNAPGSRILVDVAGQYEIVASLTAPTTAPPNAIEAVARLWAYRETLKRWRLERKSAGEQQVLAGGMMKSGAAEALRAEKWRVTL